MAADYQHPQLLASDVPPPGSHSEAGLDERIGQFGGLIPTLYTMDNLEKKIKKVQTLPSNRYTGTGKFGWRQSPLQWHSYIHVAQ